MPGQYNRQRGRQRRQDSRDAVLSETVVQWGITTIQAGTTLLRRWSRDNRLPSIYTLHPRILHEIRHEIAEPLKILFETSYKTGTLPSDWRSANIAAIYKKGNK